MLSRDFNDERLRKLLTEWDTLTDDEMKEATNGLQEVIDDIETPPIMYDNSTFRKPTKEEREQIDNHCGDYFFGSYVPNMRNGDAGLIVATKNGQIHSGVVFDLEPNTTHKDSACDYGNVALFGPLFGAQ